MKNQKNNVVAFPKQRPVIDDDTELFDVNAFVTGGRGGYMAYSDAAASPNVIRFVNTATDEVEWILTRVQREYQ